MDWGTWEPFHDILNIFFFNRQMQGRKEKITFHPFCSHNDEGN
jgi:hypothetical protein